MVPERLHCCWGCRVHSWFSPIALHRTALVRGPGQVVPPDSAATHSATAANQSPGPRPPASPFPLPSPQSAPASAGSAHHPIRFASNSSNTGRYWTPLSAAVRRASWSRERHLMAVCDPSEPRYARRKPVSNPGERPQNRQIMVQLPADPLSSWTSSRQRDVWASLSPQQTSICKRLSLNECISSGAGGLRRPA